MRKQLPVVFVLALTFCLAAFADTYEDEYENVDVVMEMAWSDAIKTVGVNVVVISHNEEPVQLVLMKKKQKVCEITLMDGVVVKVYNHESGELVATFSKSSKDFPS
jgi:hypothetical protein